MPRVQMSLVTLVVVLIFGGCASIGGPPSFRLPAGSKVQVTQELSAISGARVSIQYGRVMPRKQITRVDPHCQFFVYRSQEEMRDPLVIQPDTFTVTRTFQRQHYAWAEGVQFANAFTSGDADPTRYPTTIMELTSDQQPEVIDLRCAIWGTTFAEGYLTLNQMQAALGDLVKLQVATNRD